MPLQFIVTDVSVEELETRFHEVANEIEIFDISDCQVGLSISTKTVDTYTEEIFRQILTPYKHYDLWQGNWTEPPKRRLFKFFNR